MQRSAISIAIALAKVVGITAADNGNAVQPATASVRRTPVHSAG